MREGDSLMWLFSTKTRAAMAHSISNNEINMISNEMKETIHTGKITSMKMQLWTGIMLNANLKAAQMRLSASASSFAADRSAKTIAN